MKSEYALESVSAKLKERLEAEEIQEVERLPERPSSAHAAPATRVDTATASSTILMTNSLISNRQRRCAAMEMTVVAARLLQDLQNDRWGGLRAVYDPGDGTEAQSEAWDRCLKCQVPIPQFKQSQHHFLHLPHQKREANRPAYGASLRQRGSLPATTLPRRGRPSRIQCAVARTILAARHPDGTRLARAIPPGLPARRWAARLRRDELRPVVRMDAARCATGHEQLRRHADHLRQAQPARAGSPGTRGWTRRSRANLLVRPRSACGPCGPRVRDPRRPHAPAQPFHVLRQTGGPYVADPAGSTTAPGLVPDRDSALITR